MSILSTAENVWVIPPPPSRLSQTLQRLHNPSSTSASPARLWSSASRPWSPPQSSCPSIATTPMMKTLPVLHPHCRAKRPIPPSHPASAVSLENHIYSLMLVIGLIDDVLYLFVPLRWWSSRFKGHGHRDHQLWGGTGVSRPEHIRGSSAQCGQSHGRPSHAAVQSRILHPCQSGGPAEHRPRGVSELRLARDRGRLVGHCMTD